MVLAAGKCTCTWENRNDAVDYDGSRPAYELTNLGASLERRGVRIAMEIHMGGERDQGDDIEKIIAFVSDHPHSYASLAVCRRALDSGIERVDGGVINALRSHLEAAASEEVAAYYSIVM